MKSVSYCVALVCALASHAFATEPPITSLVFAPDGKSVVACSQAGLCVYSWPKLELQKKVKTAVVNVHDVAFSPSKDRFAVGGGSPGTEGVVEVFSWPQGKSIRVLKTKQEDSVLAVAWRDKSMLASASLDHSIWLWDVAKGNAVRQFKGHSGGVSALCFLADKKTLVSAGIDRSVRVWDSSSGKLIRSMDNHTLPVHGLALRPGQNGLPMVASASQDKTVRLWQPTIGRMVRFVRLKSKPLGVGWLSDGSRIIASCTDGHVRVIDPDSVTVTQNISALKGWAYSLAVHPTDGTLVVGGQNGQLRRILLSPQPK